MIERLTPYFPYYPYVLGGLLVLSLLMLLVALFSLWRHRTATVWRTRHDAGKRVGKLLFAGLTLMGGTVFVGALSGAVIIALDYQEAFFPPRNPYNVRGVAIDALPSPTPELTGAVDIIALDDVLTADGEAVQPRAEFAAPLEMLYVFIGYRNMTDNLPWSSALYRDGQRVHRRFAAWDFGRSGGDYFALEPVGGFLPGNYELHVSAYGQLLASAEFIVID